MARGENIYKRKDGRWEGRYPKARKMDGSIHYGYIYGRNYRTVRNQLIEKKAIYSIQNEKGNHVFHGTVGDWVNIWLNQQMVEQLKESTYASYQSKLTIHVLPVIGRIPLNSLHTGHLDQLVTQLNEKLAPNSVHIVFRIIKSCLKVAQERGHIFLNPAEHTRLPKIEKKQLPALTRGQQAQVIKESKKNTKGLPILLALETGMRIGEICALKWSDIDFEQQIINVRRTKQRITSRSFGKEKTKLIETTPKTRKAIRTIPITETLMEQLLKAKDQASSAAVVEINGHAVEPRTISYRFEKLKKKLGLSDIVFHSLRHTFATRCVEIGINIATVSALLGHASIKMTLDTYTSSFIDDQRNAMRQFEGIIL
ncbi:tyrosine-type recombinase/integrase [Candidatus Enterococcus mansonii]|uniref:Site-specific integrase n=2 Tax=Candidatus Enterococcus mansonii TaxID=1834181 RepID=A0ABU8IE57_9ENTE